MTENTSRAMSLESIGSRLQALRSQHQYSIRGLASKAGVSASLVSDIEKGKVEPSITTLNRLASAMGTTITYFFVQPDQGRGRVIRAGARMPLGPSSDVASDGQPFSGAHFELVSPTECKTVEVLVSHFDVGGWFGDEPFTHEGEEWAMVLKGRIKIIVGDEVHFLEAGDSIWFASDIPHRLENVASTESEYLWVNIPTRR